MNRHRLRFLRSTTYPDGRLQLYVEPRDPNDPDELLTRGSLAWWD